MNHAMQRFVVKLGGSLLHRPSLVADMKQWLHEHAASQASQSTYLIVVGGGRLVDVIRDFDKRHTMPSDWVHWQCVELLTTTFEVVSQWFPDWQRIRTPDQLTHLLSVETASDAGSPKVGLVCPSSFYCKTSVPKIADRLPTDWRTTTDSIAALLAATANADRLIILKSCEIEAGASVRQLVAAGVLDEAFINDATKFPRFPESKTDVRRLPQI